MKRHILAPLFLTVLCSLSLSAQIPGPDLEQMARQHWAFVTDAKTAGNCLEASSRLKWMFDNAPKHSTRTFTSKEPKFTIVLLMLRTMHC